MFECAAAMQRMLLIAIMSSGWLGIGTQFGRDADEVGALHREQPPCFGETSRRSRSAHHPGRAGGEDREPSSPALEEQPSSPQRMGLAVNADQTVPLD